MQHWSNRSGLDRRKTLWGSWAVHSHAEPGLRFWFAGTPLLATLYKICVFAREMSHTQHELMLERLGRGVHSVRSMGICT